MEVQKGRSSDAKVVATGYLESRRQAQIGAKAPGRIESVSFEEGTYVKKGQVLAVLEHADLDASLEAARATLDQSRAELAEQQAQFERHQRDLTRAQELYDGQAISDKELDEAFAANEDIF